jgi:hypothetical protein
MPFIPTPNGIALCFDFTTAGQMWQICFMVRGPTATPTTSELTAVAAIGGDTWNDSFHNLVSLETTLRQTRATDMSQEGGPEHVHLVNDAGSVTGAALPLNAAAVLSLRTDLRGRSYRGRVYISGLTQNQVSATNILNSTFMSNCVSMSAILVSYLVSANSLLSVRSLRHNGAARSSGVLTPVTAVTMDSYIDSQRRRLNGRGT